MIFFLFQGYYDIRESPLLYINGDFYIRYSSASLRSAIPVKAAYFHWKKLVNRALETNKKQVPLKSYSLKIRIDSVNQILKNKEKVT